MPTSMGEAASVLYRALPAGRAPRPELGGRSASGDTIAQESARIEAHIPGLRRFACALTQGGWEDADDLVQYCLERALGARYRSRAAAELRVSLYALLYGVFVGRQTGQRRRGVRGFRTRFSEAEPRSANEGADAVRVGRELLRAFAKLPQEQRSVLFLIGVDDFSYEEAARILNVPLVVVMSQLSSGREQLRQGTCG
jgi:RNA polymerase sigma-70 factor, ECF subfamily